MNKDGGQPFSDVARPGNTAANPTAKPVIAGNQNSVRDPMMIVSKPVNNSPTNIGINPSAIALEPNQAAAPEIISESGVSFDKPAQDPLTGHKLTHSEPFFGVVKKKSKWKKVVLFIVLAIIFAAGGVGAWMYRKDQDKKEANQKNAAQKTSTTQSATVSENTANTSQEAAIPTNKEKKVNAVTEAVASIDTPEGYLSFSSSDLGYSFAFPGEFKEIKQELTATQSDNGSAIYRSTEQPSLNGYTGQLMITQYPNAASNIVSGTGYLIALKDGKWVYDAELVGKKVGDTFVDSNGKQPTAVTAGGLKVYSFTVTEEESTIVQLVLVAKNKLNVIELPVAFSTVGNKELTTLKNNILGTLKQL